MKKFVIALLSVMISIIVIFTFAACDVKPDVPTEQNVPAPVEEERPAGSFKVTFIDDDGTVLKKQWVEDGKGATAPIVDAKGILIFDGWNKSFGNVKSDLTVTALRTKPIKSVSYKQNSMKEQYRIDDEPDTAGGKLIVVFSDNSAEEVPVLPYMIYSFDTSSESNKRSADIIYRNFQCEFFYKVRFL